MIDCISFRIRIGCFFSFKSSFKSINSSPESQHKRNLTQYHPIFLEHEDLNHIIACMMYYLTIIYLSALILSMSILSRELALRVQPFSYFNTLPFHGNTLLPELLIYLLTFTIYRCGKIEQGHLTPSKLHRIIRYRYDNHSTISYKQFRKYIVWIAYSLSLIHI